MSAEFVIPDPPWLVCKGNESRTFNLSPVEADGEFELRIVDEHEVVVASRKFDTREAAIRWGFAERQALQFDGWKHPYDAAIDEAYEEGVGNWNLFLLQSRLDRFPVWKAIMEMPASKRAAKAYAGAPYLVLLSDDELFKRFCLLMVSTMQMTVDGFLEPVAGDDELHDKYIHAATEILLRDLSLDDERARPDWSFVRTPRITRAVSAYSSRKLDWGEMVLVKYGSATFLRPALERGLFRISPAHFYEDPSLNVARLDDELERTLVDPSLDTSLVRLRAEDFSPEERALFSKSIKSTTNYYIFCLAGGWELRLFDDFEADACLVITDPSRFAIALRDASRSQLPGWHFQCASVRYIDPVQDLRFLNELTQMRFAPFFCKDFRFFYQKEIRAAWLPPDPNAPPGNLDHIFLELGSLKDYCELIEI